MDSEQVLVEAERAYKERRLAAAQRTLIAAWPDPKDAPPDARHLLGRIFAEQGRHEEAEQLLRSAVRSEPNSLRHHIALGHVLSAAFNPEGAADAYAEGLKIDRNWPGLLKRYARVCHRAGRNAEAERAAREALAQTPTDADLWEILSGALREQKKAKDALEAADQALVHAPGHASARHCRGAALAALGRHKEALEVFDELLKGGMVKPRLWLSRAAALEKLGKRADADALYQDAQRRWPQSPRVQKALAARGR